MGLFNIKKPTEIDTITKLAEMIGQLADLSSKSSEGIVSLSGLLSEIIQIVTVLERRISDLENKTRLHGTPSPR